MDHIEAMKIVQALYVKLSDLAGELIPPSSLILLIHLSHLKGEQSVLVVFFPYLSGQ